MTVALLSACHRPREAPTATPDAPPTTSAVAPWTKQFGTDGIDMARGVATDRHGRVFVAGLTTGVLPGQVSAGDQDAFVRAYDEQGQALWTDQFGSGKQDAATGIAVDGSGDIIVVGSAMGSLSGQPHAGLDDVFVRKYDGAGKERWTTLFGTGAVEFPTAVAVAPSGELFVVGLTRGALPGCSAAGADDAFVRAYDRAGKELWTAQFGTSQDDAANGVAVDAAGNVFVTGTTKGTLPGQTSAGAADAFLRVYDRAGKERWTKQFGTSLDDEGAAVVVDGAGQVTVAGATAGAFPGQTSKGRGGFVRRFDAAGAERWTRQFGSGGFDAVHALALHPSGRVLVGGYVGTSAKVAVNAQDAFLQAFDADGASPWTEQFGSDMFDVVEGIAFDAGGDVIVVGSTVGTLPGQKSLGGYDVFVRRIRP